MKRVNTHRTVMCEDTKGDRMPSSENIQVIREKDRLRITGLSRTQWWRLEREGQVPQRIPLGKVSVGWVKGEVEAWIADRAATRRVSNTSEK